MSDRCSRCRFWLEEKSERDPNEPDWSFGRCRRETLSRAITLIESAKMNNLDPQAYLSDLFQRIHDHKINRIDELLPWNWRPLALLAQAA